MYYVYVLYIFCYSSADSYSGKFAETGAKKEEAKWKKECFHCGGITIGQLSFMFCHLYIGR